MCLLLLYMCKVQTRKMKCPRAERKILVQATIGGVLQAPYNDFHALPGTVLQARSRFGVSPRDTWQLAMLF